jgi:hypothetical protein
MRVVSFQKAQGGEVIMLIEMLQLVHMGMLILL